MDPKFLFFLPVRATVQSIYICLLIIRNSKNSRIILIQDDDKFPGILYSPFKTDDLSCGMVGALNGILPTKIK